MNGQYTSNALSYIGENGSNSDYLSNSLTYVYKPEIGQRTKYTANTGTAIMTTANSNLDGTGTLYTTLTAGAGTQGTLIKTIRVKGSKTTTRGMVRIYLEDDQGAETSLITEIEVPALTQNSIQRTFTIGYEVDFMLKRDWLLKASIEKGSEDMVVTVEGLDITFP